MAYKKILKNLAKNVVIITIAAIVTEANTSYNRYTSKKIQTDLETFQIKIDQKLLKYEHNLEDLLAMQEKSDSLSTYKNNLKALLVMQEKSDELFSILYDLSKVSQFLPIVEHVLTRIENVLKYNIDIIPLIDNALICVKYYEECLKLMRKSVVREFEEVAFLVTVSELSTVRNFDAPHAENFDEIALKNPNELKLEVEEFCKKLFEKLPKESLYRVIELKKLSDKTFELFGKLQKELGSDSIIKESCQEINKALNDSKNNTDLRYQCNTLFNALIGVKLKLDR